MLSRVLPAVLLAFLAACASGPKPATGPLASTPLPAGEYAFEGEVPNVGLVTGVLHVDADGRYRYSDIQVPCPANLASTPGSSVSCRVRSLHAAPAEAGQDAATGTIVIGVSERPLALWGWEECLSYHALNGQVYCAYSRQVPRSLPPVVRGYFTGVIAFEHME
jgi:hypothetical protein